MATELSLGIQFTVHGGSDVDDKHVSLHGDYPALLRVVDRNTGEVLLHRNTNAILNEAVAYFIDLFEKPFSMVR